MNIRFLLIIILKCFLNTSIHCSGGKMTCSLCLCLRIGGPANVTIPQGTTFDTDSTGSKQLNLTCNANDVNPTGDLLAYSWTGLCSGITGNTCSFRPRPPGDDGMGVTCIVTNSYNNNQQRSHTYQLNLNCESSRLLRVT